MTTLIEHTPKPYEWAYTFGGRPAIARIHPGTLLRVTTEDCFGGHIRDTTDHPSQRCDLTTVNPVTGPFHVVGAAPGDTLAAHIVDITPARTWGISATIPHFGALTSTPTTATLQPPLPERVWPYTIDIDRKIVRYQAQQSDHHIDLPLTPMLGTLGVAPANGHTYPTTTAGTHGGNLDLPAIQAGTTVYLPVFADGALFALGDAHARQGDGEACGTGVEIATHTTIILDIIKNVSIPGPRLESDTTIMTVGCARPLDDAYRSAHCHLITWVVHLTGLDTLDAYQLISQTATTHLGNVCNPTYTLTAAIAKNLLPPTDIFAGIHTRLRALAATAATTAATAPHRTTTPHDTNQP